ncbi:acyl-CoA carboxylase epsilon subunit [Streptomyces cyaneofuscatus]|uniref:acyl-CoA carboxylase epsilon subunit n=1 Tax=Streptomyces cyaneofuscatus TaxID=66883 RepID=UPI003416D758
MSGAESVVGVVRVVRGTPRAEELAALLVVLGALNGAGTAPAAVPPPAAPWAHPASVLPAAAWLTRPRPAWRTP